jgi:hypothetical protein
MPPPRIEQRARYFVAAEGESEQSFVKWLTILAEPTLHIHLDCVVLGGGGLRSMLHEAVRLRAERSRKRGPYRDSFLIVDQDRADQGDCSIEALKSEAAKDDMTVCVQRPNHEGLLLRMFCGMENEIADRASAVARLKSRWPTYQKPADARALTGKFSRDDLVRLAGADSDVDAFLRRIGLI